VTEVVELRLPERLDSRSAPEFERSALALVVAGAKLLVRADDVVYMSAAGIRTLVRLSRGAIARGASMAMTGFGKAASDCLDASGFAGVLPIFESLDEARHAAVSGRARPS